MPDSIKTPDALVKEFKKSGEFDRLRRELLAQFQNEDGTEAFWARVDDIARARLDAEDKLHLKAADTLHRELLQELDRFPLVERAVADVPALADPEFAAGIRRHAESLVRRSRGIPGTCHFVFFSLVFFLFSPLPALPPPLEEEEEERCGASCVVLLFRGSD